MDNDSRRQYYLKNREKILAQAKAYREAKGLLGEAGKEKRRAYYEANRERMRAAGRKWWHSKGKYQRKLKEAGIPIPPELRRRKPCSNTSES